MNKRQEKLLKSIIDEYVKTAQPVGSNLLVAKYLKNVSSATVRNEMAELEKQGLITHPHTSAGRIPTEKGYKYYLDNFLKDSALKEVGQLKQTKEPKQVAKELAEISGLAVIISFTKEDVYYTGISNVFSQPEFHEYNLAYNFTSVIDHLDEVVSQIYDTITETVEVRIGEENPFGADCGLIITKNNNKLIALIGPIRMDYQKNINLIKYAKTLI
ncbi:hypothetical protein HQ544_02365 [Candidatus Falkowbacteria bacterium]|nr:hypothetical protein [Candidatus Falkowbacteria bacterium]